MGITRQLESLVRSRLDATKLGRRELAERLRYRNLAKACNRVDTWMRGGPLPKGSQLDKLAVALGVPPAEIEAANTADLQADMAWEKQLMLNYPTFSLRIRIHFGRYADDKFPEGISEADAIERASTLAATWNRQLCMTSPGAKHHFWFDKEGRLVSKQQGPGPSIFGGWMEAMWIAAQRKKLASLSEIAAREGKMTHCFKPDLSGRPANSETSQFKTQNPAQSEGRLADGRPYLYESAYSSSDGLLRDSYFIDATGLENADSEQLTHLLAESGIHVVQTPFEKCDVRLDISHTHDAKGQNILILQVRYGRCDDPHPLSDCI